MGKVNNKYRIAQDFKYEGDDWWSWWVWIEGTNANLGEIDHVIYTLHSTYKNPVRKIDDRQSKFKLKTEGWGTFMIYARVVSKSKEEYFCEHELQLDYPDGTKNIE